MPAIRLFEAGEAGSSLFDIITVNSRLRCWWVAHDVQPFHSPKQELFPPGAANKLP